MKALRTAPWSLSTTGAALLVVLAVVAVYSNTLRVPLVFDDTSSIANNLSIRQLWPLAFPEIGGTRGRPVANVSFAVNYVWGRNHLAGYHAVNIIIHAAAALALFGLVRRTLRLPGVEPDLAGAANFIAGSAALLWAVHPLQTEAVTYLSQRTEALMGLFYLTTLYCFARGIGSPENRRAWHGLAVLACAAGMGSKEVMVTAPLVVLLYDRAFVAGGLLAALRARRGFHLALSSTWVVLAGLMMGMGARGVGFKLGVSPAQYALTESCAVLNYLKLAVWPAPLVFDYGSFTASSLAAVWPCVLLVVALVTAALALLAFRPKMGFLLAWPFLLLAPTSSFVPVALQPMAEHRMYLPLAAVAVAAAVLLASLRLQKSWIVVLFLGAALGAATLQRNATYADEIELWRDTVKKRPANDRALTNLGAALLKHDRVDEARAPLTRAVALNPRNPEALTNLGFLHARDGKLADATDCFERTVQLAPGLATAHYNLGCVLLKTGRIADAGKSFARAIQLNPDYGDAHDNLGIILAAGGRFEAAIEHFSESLRVNPRDAEAYVNRAAAHLKLNRPANARADYQAALALRPDLAEVRRQLEILQSPAAK